MIQLKGAIYFMLFLKEGWDHDLVRLCPMNNALVGRRIEYDTKVPHRIRRRPKISPLDFPFPFLWHNSKENWKDFIKQLHYVIHSCATTCLEPSNYNFLHPKKKFQISISPCCLEIGIFHQPTQLFTKVVHLDSIILPFEFTFLKATNTSIFIIYI